MGTSATSHRPRMLRWTMGGVLAMLVALLVSAEAGMLVSVASWADRSASTGQASAETPCPIHHVACEEAAGIAEGFLSGNLDALLGRLTSSTHVCPGPEPVGVGGPFPLCDGASAGEVREGYPWTIAFTG